MWTRPASSPTSSAVVSGTKRTVVKRARTLPAESVLQNVVIHFFFKKKKPQNPSSLNRLPFTLPFSGDVRFGQHQDQTKGWPKPMSADLAVARKGRERPTNCGAGTMRHISTICCRSTAIRPSASGWHANATTKPCRSRWLIIIKCFSIGFARPMELSGCVRRIVSIELFEEMETVYLFVCFFAFLMLYDE